MDKNTERTAKKRIKILHTAIKLFIEKDIKKVTMDDIAMGANVSKMTVYKYFTDKESLYGYAAGAVLEQCGHDMKEQVALQNDVIQKMTGCMGVLTGFITQGYLSLCMDLAALNDEVKSKIGQFNSNIKEIIISLIIEGKKSGLIRGDIGDECIYHYIDMGLNYFQHNLNYRKRMTDDPSFRKDYMTFIWSNIFIDYTAFTC